MKTNKVKFLVLALIAGLVLLTGCTATKTAEVQKAKPSWKAFHAIVDAEFVKANWAMRMPANMMLVDSRPYKGKYIKGHIPGAINMPWSGFNKNKNIDLLPKKKDDLLIFYCEGPTWSMSHKAAWKAEKLGYTNVKVYTDGYPDWIKQKGNYGSVSVEFVAAQIAGNKAILIDARPNKTKFVKGSIPTAINIPFTQFEKFSGKLPRDLNTPLIAFCEGMKWTLSHKTAREAIKLGYTNVTIFATGYPAWKKAYGGGKEAVKVTAGASEGTIDLKKFEDIIAKNPESIILIDVRDPDEFATGSFKTAVNIPVDTLEAKIKGFSADKPIVYFCATGARSGEAFYMTMDVRESLKNVFYVDAEIEFKDGKFTIKKP